MRSSRGILMGLKPKLRISGASTVHGPLHITTDRYNMENRLQYLLVVI